VNAMTKEEFWKRVDTQLHRPNDKERYALRDELEAHIEDHALALEETGCPAEETEARAVEAMGEPEEIGKALNNQFSVFWQVMIWVGTLVIMVLVWQILSNGWSQYGSQYQENKQARTDPAGQVWFMPAFEERYTLVANPEIRTKIGNDELYIYWVGIDPENNKAQVAISAYDENPVGWVAQNIMNSIWVENQAGDVFYKNKGYGDVAVSYMGIRDIPVEREDTHLLLRHNRLGRDLTVEIPLPWEVSP